MSCLVIPLHQQLVAGVQDAAAGNHQDGSHGRSLADGDDSGVIGLPVGDSIVARQQDAADFSTASAHSYRRLNGILHGSYRGRSCRPAF